VLAGIEVDIFGVHGWAGAGAGAAAACERPFIIIIMGSIDDMSRPAPPVTLERSTASSVGRVDGSSSW